MITFAANDPFHFTEPFSNACSRLGGSIYEEMLNAGQNIRWCKDDGTRLGDSISITFYGRIINSTTWSTTAFLFFESQQACLTNYQLQESPQEPSFCNMEGNPCNPATGNKFQIFTDYTSSSNHDFSFKRTYQSQNNSLSHFTAGWQHSYQSVMDPEPVVLEPFPANTMGTNNLGLQQSAPYSTPENACSSGWQNIKNQAFRGMLSTEQVQYAGGISVMF